MPVLDGELDLPLDMVAVEIIQQSAPITTPTMFS
jgi:hypothetical protein